MFTLRGWKAAASFAMMLLSLSSCSLKFFGMGGGETTEKAAVDDAQTALEGPGQIPAPTLDEMSLKQAKLWARVDELEELVFYQKERIQLLEQGLLLGMVPEELRKQRGPDRSGHPEKANPNKQHKLQLEKKPATATQEEAVAPPKPNKSSDAAEMAAPLPPGESSPQDDLYTTRLKDAQEHFENERYGRAIAEYSSIGKEFPDRIVDGSHHFWIALSWAKLKEYETARQQFAEFIQEYPLSPWTPRAKLELARVEIQSGLKEKGASHLNEVIRDYPNADAAEMARMELKQMRQTL